MKVIKLPLDALKRPEKNIRRHTDKQLKEFERSVAMFGQIRPIVVDENNEILAGNGLYETLLRMGKTEAEVYQVKGLTANQKKKLMIADNKIFDLGVDNLDVFDEFLVELKDDMDIPGFDEDILRTMVSEADNVSEKLKEYGTVDNEKIAEIKAAKERKNALIAKVADKAADDDASEAAGSIDDNDCIVCPNCGEQIWL